MHICRAHVARLHVVGASIADLADPKQHHWQPGGCLRLHGASKMCHAFSHACKICAMIPHACKICDGFLHAHTDWNAYTDWKARHKHEEQQTQTLAGLLYAAVLQQNPCHLQGPTITHVSNSKVLSPHESDLHLFTCRVAAV